MFWMALLVAVPSVCALLGWLGWLRLVRHFHDHSGPEALRHLPAVARAYRAPATLAERNQGRPAPGRPGDSADRL